ncbi:member of major facilitator superfamily multidrug-resistance, DHA1 sub-family [Lentinula raphanica]|uniref:Member of major facilitator superfamily multidrug-resistance, DHA1 sub-family n=1 Tax=Lentinula raphanica TaxID=153919 RepID=A0AA38PBP5_9AGAR|nr:major facilitator superfamily multidrug-resistance, DHA1 sub-family [Lentinula raphanica]KAJ3772286.1 member of major facilitator superfamily multidrug-resistance, DHA1 sub-family [Lentinula raphanica]KAJ3829580.1 member of major facilitator superfamily multidrug-resistance, DHA1 sub-family [Lentinula raphanica]KAJ3839959.1 member of major facilitator superfamily multidrug-resistance, DHA1 sub-family [Lentinula raphanica]
MSPQVDEETPLLQEQHHKPERTPLPWFQFTIVLFLQLAEPLTSQVIYPFLPQLIRDIGITQGDETKVGHYVGLLQSLFFLTQAMTVLHWSRISDSIGRKPVILIGLFGLSMSMYCFGLSTTFWGLVFSRSLNGALNGNIGVIKSIMAEMTDATNIAQAYAYMPIAWSTGGVLGPMIGGALARPADQFPQLFGNNDFLKKYPYFLPCAVPATFSAIAWLVTFCFLKETVQAPTFALPKIFRFKSYTGKISPVSEINDVTTEIPDNEKPVPFRKLLNRRVLIAAGNYATLSLVDITFRAIQPLFFSTPLELGGLGLPPSSIGNLLSVFGLLNGVMQIFFFAQLHDYWGSKKTFIMGIASTVPIFICFPILTYLVKSNGCITPLAWMFVGLQIMLSLSISFSYGAIFIYISAASPNRASLGATNGLSQMTVSICRAIGPAASNSLFSLSMRHHYMGGFLVYYVLLSISVLALVAASMLPRQV